MRDDDNPLMQTFSKAGIDWILLCEIHFKKNLGRKLVELGITGNTEKKANRSGAEKNSHYCCEQKSSVHCGMMTTLSCKRFRKQASTGYLVTCWYTTAKASSLVSKVHVMLDQATPQTTMIVPSSSNSVKPHVIVCFANGKCECQDCPGYSSAFV